MKLLIIVIFLCSATSFASEVKTECNAMNESRENINKDVKPKAVLTKGSSIQ